MRLSNKLVHELRPLGEAVRDEEHHQGLPVMVWTAA